MPRAPLDFGAILRVLHQHGVDSIVVGGVCAVVRGAPVTTFDLDLVHARSPENIQRLQRALQALSAYYRQHAETRPTPQREHLAGPGHHLLMTDAGPLDLLGEVAEGQTYGDLLPRSDQVTLGDGLAVRFLTLPALIRLKEQTGRAKDIAVLPVLRNTLIQQQRGSAPPGSSE